MAVFVFDSFTDTAATTATAHQPEAGGPIFQAIGGNPTISSANRMRNGSGFQGEFAYKQIPIGPDCEVEASIYCASVSGEAAIFLRGQGSGLTGYYFLQYNGTNWQLVIEGGNFATLGTFAQVLTPGQRYKIKLKAVGSTITVYVDNVQIIQVTDAQISQNGFVGVLLNGNTTDTTGLHLDYFSAIDLDSAPPALMTSNKKLELDVNYPWSQALVFPLDATGWSAIDFIAKANATDADGAAKVAIRLSSPAGGSDGLYLLNGAAPIGGASASDGSITNVNIVAASSTAPAQTQLTVNLTARGAAITAGGYYWEVAVYNSNGVKQSWLGSGTLKATQTVLASPAAP